MNPTHACQVWIWPFQSQHAESLWPGCLQVHTGGYTFRFGIEEMPRDQGFLEHTFEAY